MAKRNGRKAALKITVRSWRAIMASDQGVYASQFVQSTIPHDPHRIDIRKDEMVMAEKGCDILWP